MLESSRILVTGATGLIGKTLVFNLIRRKAKVTVVVRDLEKAKRLFENHVQYIVGDVRTVNFESLELDYIIHAASQTSSQYFIKKPVETISVAIDGTRNILNNAIKQRKLKRFIYLSTMEVYGTPLDDSKITEEHGSNLDTTSVRSCYPESKRMCENICISYASEYGIPVNILRLTQTFGPGVEYQDKRVFAEFARCAFEGKDIILQTKGETRRSYLYTEDAVNAILTVAKYGQPNLGYNGANENTYCSIYEMAKMVADKLAGGRIKVIIKENKSNDRGFAPVLHMNLDTTRLQKLGWEPKVDLYGMYKALIDDWRKNI